MMKKVFIIASTIILLMIVISSANYKRNTYKQGLECFENKKWSCAIEKLENLNYKDSEDKLRNARYENYIQTANYNLEQKSYQRALSQYKEAFLLNPSNEDIKVKIESLEIIIKEQQKREEIKRKQQEEENRRNAIKAKISSDAIYQIPTKFGEGYDETIKRYGVATINRINKLAPKAAELVAQNPNCTRVMAVDVSDERSSRNSLTFYADCGDIGDIMNIQRFYISEKEINTKIVPKSVKEQSESINNNQYLTMCEAEIKARLNFPSTYKQNNLLSGVYKAPMNTVVTIPFKAKNALNLELKHKGTCYYNGMTLKDIDILEEK